jgi:PiT family inorganic phosphate transporter
VPPNLIALIALALLFDFLNGVHDSSNLVATVISSRALPPRLALMLTAAAVFTGPFLLGVAVAETIGAQVVVSSAITLEVILAALCTAILWNLLTWFLGVPSSSSHALIGGLVGAAWMSAGLGAIQFGGVEKVLISLFLSPLLGLTIGFLTTRLVFFLARNATPGVNIFFKRAQVLTAMGLALSYGANDAQKTMGVITLGLVIHGALDAFRVPLWVILVSAGAIALGISTGGWRLIRTLGGRFYKIKPVDGFCTQAASAGVIFSASLLGGPVSSTQVVGAAILGVGAAERLNKVRWGVAGEIAVAWIITIPATALLSAALYWLGGRIFG